MNMFTDDELRVILTVMNQSNYPVNLFGIVGGIVAKLQIAVQPDLQPMSPPEALEEDGRRPSRAERRRTPKAESEPKAE